MKTYFLFLLIFIFSLSINGQPIYFDWGHKCINNNPQAASSTGFVELILDADSNIKVLVTSDTNSKITTYSPSYEILNEVQLPVRCFNLAINHNGEFVVSGYFSGAMDFDPGMNSFSLAATNDTDQFIACYDSDGNLIWAKKFDGDYQYPEGVVREILTDEDNNILVAGNFYDTLDFDPGPGVHKIGSYKARDMFLLKLNSSGELQWVNRYGCDQTPMFAGPDSDEDERLMSMNIDQNGDIVLTGKLIVPIDFDPNSTTPVMSPPGRFFVARISSSGNLIWVKTIIQNVGTHLFVSDANTDLSGNIFVTTIMGGTVDIDPGVGVVNVSSSSSYATYLLKLDANGNLVWSKFYKGTNDVYGMIIKFDIHNNIYLYGKYRGEIDFGIDSSIFVADNEGSTGYYKEADSFFSKFDPNGNLIWVYPVTGKSEEQFTEFEIDTDGNLYTIGSFGGTVFLNPSSPADSLVANGINWWDKNSMIMKLTAANIAHINHLAWLYPNSNNGGFYLELYQQAQVTIFDLNGNIVFSEAMVEDRHRFELFHLAAATYIIHIKSTEAEQTIKMVVHE